MSIAINQYGQERKDPKMFSVKINNREVLIPESELKKYAKFTHLIVLRCATPSGN